MTERMRPSSYEAAARKCDSYARKLRERAHAKTPREQASLTTAVHGLARFAKDFSRRHRRATGD